jgi:hypothetical protein
MSEISEGNNDGVLIHAWMRMRDPQLTNDMVDFLISNKKWVQLFKYISCVNTTATSTIVNVDNSGNNDDSSSTSKHDTISSMEDVKLSNIDVKNKRNIGRLDSIAQSWKATMLFAGKDIQGNEENLISFFLPLEHQFVQMLVECFHPSSNVCIHHVCYIFSRLIQKKPKDLFRILSSKDNELFNKLIPSLFYYIHHSAVSSLLVDLICIRQPVGFVSRTYAPGDFVCSPAHIILADKAFIQLDFFQLLLVPLLDNYEICNIMKIELICDTLRCLLERLSRSPHHELIIEYLTMKLPGIVTKLFNVILSIQNTGNAEDCKRNKIKPLCIDVLLSLTQSIFPIKVEGFNVAPYHSFATNIAPIINNKLHAAATILYNAIIIYFNEYIDKFVMCNYNDLNNEFVDNICNNDSNNLNGVQHTSYFVRRPFTYARMKELEFILIIIKYYEDTVNLSRSINSDNDDNKDNSCTKNAPILQFSPHPIDQLPLDFLNLLCHWFFSYSHSNMYHCLFLKFLQRIILSSKSKNIIRANILPTSEDDVFNNVVVDDDFVSKAIYYYENAGPNTSSRGHILECLRLLYRKSKLDFEKNTAYINCAPKLRQAIINDITADNNNRKNIVEKSI